MRLMLLCISATFAQVGINTTSPSSLLQIASSNQANPANTDGILIPKIDAFPAINPTLTQNGMMVFLTTSVGINLPGFYYWDNNTTAWISVGSQHNWGLNGNQGTNSSINFIGTKDNQSLIIKTNDTERLKIDNTGNIGIGGTNPSYPLEFKSITGDKICLFNTAPLKSYGFGVNASLLQIFSSNIGSSIGFGYGSSTSFTENIRFTGGGRVGIGTSNPLSKIHLFESASGITPNVNSVLTLEKATGNYLNLLSSGESGILFGANGNATNGGIIYNSSQPDAMFFRTNNNQNRMIISAAGDVVIGNGTPDARLQIISSNQATPANTDGILIPKIDAFPAINPTLTQNGMMVFLTTSVGINLPGFYYWDTASSSWLAIGAKSNWNLTGNSGTNPGTNFIGSRDNSDVVFKTNNTEGMRLTTSGNIGIGTASPTAELEVNGFTKMGTTAPAIKTLKLTGTTGATQGNQTNIAHGINSAKILGVTVLVEYVSGSFIPTSYNSSIGFEFDYFITGTNVVVWTKSGNSGFILSKPIRVLLTYEQ